MCELMKIFRKSVSEGFASFIWQSNNSVHYPFSSIPIAFLQDKENIDSDSNYVKTQFNQRQNGN
jgi:hypothetical protein